MELLRKSSIFLFVFLAGIRNFLPAQTYDFGFERDFSVSVFLDTAQMLKFPWAGGLNSAHVSQVDLNQNGIKDLVIFDNHTEKLYTFLNNGTTGQVDYVYAPEYEMKFPKLYSWVRMIDFNGDGKEDIFTYGFAGIKVYTNTSTSAGLSFSLYTPILNAYQGGNYTNILITNYDYPAIGDVDGDGDLDVIVFYGLGALMQFYKNMSIENTSTADTLWMELKNRCWGWIAENNDSNDLTLNIDVIDTGYINYCQFNLKKSSNKDIFGKNSKHTGSTMTLLDLNGDNVIDMLLGDNDYPNVVALFNCGTSDSARICSLDYHFPFYDIPIDIYSLTTSDYVDVNNDGIKDLVAGSFDPSWEVPKADNQNNLWWYKNTGTNSIPVFTLQQENFIQEDMIDVGANSHPVLFDYNNDGLLDLFVGNFGTRDSSWMDPWLNLYSYYSSRIHLYENIGTQNQPAFRHVTDDFANVSSKGLVGAYPTFGDINGDGKPDMILGDTTGRLHYYENVAPTGYPMQLNYVSSNYQGIDVGMFSTPQLFDLDDDSLLDLIIGYRRGVWEVSPTHVIRKTSLAYYRNTGTLTSPQFTFQTDSLGGVNVNDSYFHFTDGYSSPCFYRDTNGVISLFMGSGPGLVFYYRNIAGNLAGVFEKDSTMFHITDYDHFYSVQHFKNQDGNPQTIDVKRKSVVTMGDLYGNGYPDMVIGNIAGGLSFFKGVPPLGIGIPQQQKQFTGDVNIFPNPASYRVNVVIKDVDRSVESTTTIYSVTGQVMMQIENSGDDFFPVDIYNLPNGLYIMKIDVESPQQGTIGSFSRKLVVKR